MTLAEKIVPKATWLMARSQGPGGQHANCHNTRAIIKIPWSVLPIEMHPAMRKLLPLSTQEFMQASSQVHRTFMQNQQVCLDTVHRAIGQVVKELSPPTATNPAKLYKLAGCRRLANEKRLQSKHSRSHCKSDRRSHSIKSSRD